MSTRRFLPSDPVCEHGPANGSQELGLAISHRRRVAQQTSPPMLDRYRDVDETLRAELLRVLPIPGRSDREAFAALPDNEQLVVFFNWQSRLIHPHRREIYRSLGFHESDAYRANADAVNRLCGKLAAGVDVTPHLSRDVRVGYTAKPSQRKNGRDLDLTLNDWGIHHLHLSHDLEKDGTNKRTKHLLFAMFTHGKAYALAVGDHNSWTNEALVQAAVQSWPTARLFAPLDGIIPGEAPGPRDIDGLRKAGVLVATVLDGVAYLPTLTCGLSSATTSLRDSRRASELRWTLRQFCESPEAFVDQMREQAERLHITFPARPRLELVWASSDARYGFALREEATNLHLML